MIVRVKFLENNKRVIEFYIIFLFGISIGFQNLYFFIYYMWEKM